MRACLLCVLACLVVPTTSLRIDSSRLTSLSRRSAIAGIAPIALAGSVSAADTCFGKCPEDATKRAERLAVQLGTSAAVPPTIEQLIQKSIQQRENTLGMELSDGEKEKIAEKVRAAYPGVK